MPCLGNVYMKEGGSSKTAPYFDHFFFLVATFGQILDGTRSSTESRGHCSIRLWDRVRFVANMFHMDPITLLEFPSLKSTEVQPICMQSVIWV